MLMAVFENVKKSQLKALEQYRYIFIEIKTKHEAARMDGPAKLVLYNSGKLVIQGKDADDAEKLIRALGIGSQATFEKEEGVVIGSDETLKGDTFGGIVVVGVRCNDEERKNLVQLGVADSKKIKDEHIETIAKQIMRHCHYSVKNLSAKEYNDLVEVVNGRSPVTVIMNELHTTVAKELGESLGAKHIVDKYPGCTVGDKIETKADSKYVEVAAASIIARHFALKQLSKIRKDLGLDSLPKGSTHIEEALEALKKKKFSPSKYVKKNFRNVKYLFN